MEKERLGERVAAGKSAGPESGGGGGELRQRKGAGGPGGARDRGPRGGR